MLAGWLAVEDRRGLSGSRGSSVEEERESVVVVMCRARMFCSARSLRMSRRWHVTGEGRRADGSEVEERRQVDGCCSDGSASKQEAHSRPGQTCCVLQATSEDRLPVR
jgi:hypothetical protein